MRGRRLMAAAGAVVLVLSTALTGTAASAGEPAGRGSVGCGGLVAYSEQGAGANTSRLMAVPAIGGAPRVVWDRPDADQGELDPAWSPDGRLLAFVGRPFDATGFPVGNRLYVMPAGAGEPRLLVEQKDPDGSLQRGSLRLPTWSADGSRIAYATAVPPAGEVYRQTAWVRMVDVGHPERNVLLVGLPAPSVVQDLDWSPRGDQLLVTGYDPSTSHWTIYSLRPDPAEPRLTVLISDDSGARASTGFPAFLPGGRAVLVEQDEPDYVASRLYLADPRLQHLVPVTPRPGWETQPDFGLSPVQAVYQRYNDDRTETSIAVLTLPTGASRSIVDHVVGVYVERPNWQPVLGCRPWPFLPA